jgi:hypothetical protein
MLGALFDILTPSYLPFLYFPMLEVIVKVKSSLLDSILIPLNEESLVNKQTFDFSPS